MIYMAQSIAHRLGSCGVAVGTAAAGVVAQVTAPADSPSVGQIGLTGTVIGASYLIIAVIREGGPLLMKMRDDKARDAYIRLETKLHYMEQQNGELQIRLSAAEQEARDAKNLVENAKIAADARAAEIERRAREAGHLAKSNSKRLDYVEQVQASTSGELPAPLPPPPGAVS